MTLCPEVWTEDFEIKKKSVSWVPAFERESRDSELGEVRRICVLWAPRVGWVENWRCKSSLHRKIVSPSPHIKKPWNSKRWIKVSYLNQFRVFGFLYMFMNILWTLCLFHISVSLVCYIKMEIGIEKCAMVVMKSGKRHMTKGVELSNPAVIRTCKEKETYKYLGILEADTIRQQEMWEKKLKREELEN